MGKLELVCDPAMNENRITELIGGVRESFRLDEEGWTTAGEGLEDEQRERERAMGKAEERGDQHRFFFSHPSRPRSLPELRRPTCIVAINQNVLRVSDFLDPASYFNSKYRPQKAFQRFNPRTFSLYRDQ